MRLCGVSLSYLDPAGPRGPEGVMTKFSRFGLLRLTGTIMFSVDTNGLRHLPRQSSNNYDLEYANTDRQTDLRIIIE